MSIIADLQETYTVSRRLYYIQKYEPDRINEGVRLEVCIFENADARKAFKDGKAKALDIQGQIKTLQKDYNAKIFTYTQLSDSEQSAKYEEQQKITEDFDNKQKALNDQVKEAQTETNKNVAKTMCTVNLVRGDVDVEKFTLADLYKALAKYLKNPEDAI